MTLIESHAGIFSFILCRLASFFAFLPIVGLGREAIYLGALGNTRSDVLFNYAREPRYVLGVLVALCRWTIHRKAHSLGNEMVMTDLPSCW